MLTLKIVFIIYTGVTKMEVFSLTLTQMLMMFVFILIGIVLNKSRILPDNTDMVLSRLHVYAFAPAQICYAMMKYCTVEAFKENAFQIGYGTFFITLAIVISYPLSRLFVRKPKENHETLAISGIYKYGLAFANNGIIGNFLVLGLWGTDMLFRYSMYRLPLDILSYLWGFYVLLPKDRSVHLTKSLMHSLLTPPIICCFLGMILGLTGIAKFIPEFIGTAFNNASNTVGPVAMITAGFVIGRYNFKDLLSLKKTYLMTALRLLILPGLFLTGLTLLNAPKETIMFTLIAFASPIGMNTIVVPASYGGDTHIGASMVMISNVLSCLTIPLMFMIFVGQF